MQSNSVCQRREGLRPNSATQFSFLSTSLHSFSAKIPHKPTPLVRNVESKSINSRKTTISAQSVASLEKDITLVWFKRDLRLDDNPGLHQALLSTSAHIIPFFCFDPVRYGHIVDSPATAAALARAVASLRSSLRSLGSDLLISTGSWEEQIPAIMCTLGGGSIVYEEELESSWKDGVVATFDRIKSSAACKGEKQVSLHPWTATLFNTYTGKFPEWKKQREAPNEPLNAPATLPPLPASAQDLLSTTNLPAASDLFAQVEAARAQSTDPALLHLFNMSTTKTTTKSVGIDDEIENENGILAADAVIDHLSDTPSTSETISTVVNENMIHQSGGGGTASSSADWTDELTTELAAGEGPVMKALNAYLSHVETTGDGGGSDWQWKLGSAIAKFDIPAAPAGCFPAIFNTALALGVVSRRRIYSEAAKMIEEKQRGGGDIPVPAGLLAKLGWLLTSSGGALVRQRRLRKATAAAAATEAADFHTGLATSREGASLHGGATLRHWRWKGTLTDYLVATPPPEGVAPLPGAPAVLLVHGFGAFSEHWRDNVAAIAAQGFTVYAPTLPGYGRAEKPAAKYGQDLWRNFLADFVVQVVRRPVAAAGNSIGGFITASMAADHPGTVTGLILVNSAGLLQEQYTPPAGPPVVPSPPLFVVNGVSRALFDFLQGDVMKQLQRVYPVAPQRVDAWLGNEISRASFDPGALGVFRSVFYLPKPRALNYLVGEVFKGPTLCLQGAKDPLNDAVGRAKELDRLCENVKVVMLDAGHCPHDEVPEEFNRRLVEFLKSDVIQGVGEKH